MVKNFANKQTSMKKGKAIPTGGNKMMHRQASGPQKAGVSSQEHSGTKSKTPVRGGSTKMFGKSTVKTVKPA